MKKIMICLISLNLVCGGAPLFAAESVSAGGTPAGLEKLLALAQEQNAELKAARARWQAARKSVLASWALKDPMVGFEIMGADRETRSGPEMQKLMVSQEIPFPLKLWKRRAAAKAAARAEQERYFAARRVVIQKIKKAWYELHGVEESLGVIGEVKELLEKFQKVAQARYANRSGSQRDAAKAQAEMALALEQELMLRQRREALAAALNMLVNRSPLDTVEAPSRPEVPEVKETFTELLGAAAVRRSEVLAAEAEAAKSLDERALAWLENLPDLKAGFQYNWVGSGTTSSPSDGRDSWMFPLSINVPLWQNRILPEIQAAGQRADAAHAEAEQVRNEIFFELREAYVRFDASRQIVQLYEDSVLPQTQLALSSDQAGYESSSVGFLELLDSERVYLNTRLAYARLYAGMMQAHADLEKAAGIDMGGGL